MNKRNKVVAVITSILLAASMASLSIPAQAEQNTDVAPMSCPEIGHHQSVSNKGRIFMAGSLPKNWLSPGGTYTVTKAKTTTVTGSVTGGVDAEFSSYVKAHVQSSLSTSQTVSESQGWSWTNTSNTTKWVQLGAAGYEFDYTRYDVVSPCNVVNQKYKHAKMPTTSHGYITIDVSMKHRGNTRGTNCALPPFLEFFCGGKH